MYITFDQLELTDLLNTAQVNSDCARVASNIFRRKYSNYVIEILEMQHKKLTVYSAHHLIAIQDFDLAFDVMKYFGRHIRKLNIRNNDQHIYPPGKGWTEVVRFVNE